MSFRLQKTSYKGFVHYVDGDFIIRSHKGEVYFSHDGGTHFHKIIDLGHSITDRVKLSHPKIRRLLRYYIYHILPIGDAIVVFGLKKIFVISTKNQEILREFKISGSRPLVICKDEKYIYYGEYFSNKERKPVKIFRFNPENEFIETHIELTDVRHIHGMFYDPYSKKIFLTTGDTDDESFIGYLETGKVKKILSGSQQARVVTLLFDQHYIYFATDAPREVNYIYRYCRKSKEVEKLQELGGTVFYGVSVKNSFVFSTVADTNKEQRQDSVELWGSDNGTDWQIVKEFEKDPWPKSLFQHGQLLISDKQYNTSTIWFTPFATSNDQIIHKLRIN